MIKSIRELVPLDISGRHARKGFSYQDHVAVGLCISFLTQPLLKEIWLETHDDILLFWENAGNTTIEFVQVKAIDQQSRWSVPLLCGNGTPKDSIIKKLMDQDRCTEAVRFRIVSSYDVNQDLSVLKIAIDSIERQAASATELSLAGEIKKKIGDLKSPNGKTVVEWTKLCWWEKKADNLQDLISSNKIALENALASIGKTLLWDQRDELYQKILKFCQDASTGDLSLNSDLYKISRQKFIHWLDNTIDSLYTPSRGTEKLEEKLGKAKNVPKDYIPAAKQLRWSYVQKRLSNDFIQPSDMNTLESVVLGELYKMKIALDNDQVDEEQFHKLCIDKLDEIKNSDVFRSKNIPDYLFTGYMYKLTSDCLHRFRKVEA
jgi:hypothetical protein